MTHEMQQMINDPNYIVQLAVGDPMPNLLPQNPDNGICLSGLYFKRPKRFLLKNAHFSRVDYRIFDVETGRVVLVSHHPGKNPYESLDPLGLTNQGNKYKVSGTEWESACDVSGYCGFPNISIRPKTLSRHGRQYIKMNNNIVMNVGKMSKLKTASFRPHFQIARGDRKEISYTCVADMMGRTVSIMNENDELVAQVAKTNKALIQMASFGSGNESTIDIAPGVDCSTILAAFLGIGQVGNHLVFDLFNGYVKDPLQDAAVDSAVEAVGVQDYVQGYEKMSHSLVSFHKTGEWIYNNFFK